MGNESPAYILSTAPEQSVRFAHFFDSGADSVAQMLQRPESLRHAGWNVQTLDQARIVGAQYWEVTNGDRKVFRLYEDGTFIARAVADGSFLAWGMEPGEFAQKPRLNTLALIEYTTEFALFYGRVLKKLAALPKSVRAHVEFKNVTVNGNKLFVVPFLANQMGWLIPTKTYPISDESALRDISLETSLVIERPGHFAYRLVESAFLLFGVPANEIPLVKAEGSLREIAIDKIATIR